MFLDKSKTIIDNFKNEENLKVQTYVGICCKYFTRNIVRKFNTKKSRVVQYGCSFIKEMDNSIHLSCENEEEKIEFDFSKLNNDENKAIHLRYYEDYKLKDIAKCMCISTPKVSRLCKSALLKLKCQVKKMYN